MRARRRDRTEEASNHLTSRGEVDGKMIGHHLIVERPNEVTAWRHLFEALLANPHLRRVFLAHVRDIYRDIYTEEAFYRIIAATSRADSRGQVAEAGRH
jgi:hypothetical protein